LHASHRRLFLNGIKSKKAKLPTLHAELSSQNPTSSTTACMQTAVKAESRASCHTVKSTQVVLAGVFHIKTSISAAFRKHFEISNMQAE